MTSSIKRASSRRGVYERVATRRYFQYWSRLVATQLDRLRRHSKLNESVHVAACMNVSRLVATFNIGHDSSRLNWTVYVGIATMKQVF